MRVSLKLLIHESGKMLLSSANCVFREGITGGDEGVARKIPDQFARGQRNV